MDPTHRSTSDAADPRANARRRRTPSWVIVFLVVIAVVIALLVLSAVLGVDHGPGRHAGFAPVAARVAA